jgi:uncharacterized protein
MKYLVLLGIIVLAWVLFFKGRRRPPPVDRATDSSQGASQAAPMLACTHCGLHLPKTEAVLDAEGRPYCGEAHRLAGPR